MTWVYRDHDDEGELKENAPELPPPGFVYLAFDACRWALVIGYTEKGGYSSFLDPNVSDDCNIVAFAPLDERSAPDLKRLLATGPWTGPQYHDRTVPQPWYQREG